MLDCLLPNYYDVSQEEQWMMCRDESISGKKKIIIIIKDGAVVTCRRAEAANDRFLAVR